MGHLLRIISPPPTTATSISVKGRSHAATRLLTTWQTVYPMRTKCVKSKRPYHYTDIFQIRNKRLAKLGGSASTSTQPDTPSDSQKDDTEMTNQQSTSEISEEKKAQIMRPETSKNNLPTASPATNTPQNPFSQLAKKQSNNNEAPKINIKPSSHRPVSLKRDRRPSTGEKQKISGEALEQWEDSTLSEIFRVTLYPEHQKDVHGHRLRFLQSTKQDIEESGEEVRFSTGTLDQALLEAASSLGKGITPLDYLLGCWKRVTKEWKPLRKGGEQDPKFVIVREARRLCMSYCIFAITMPDMFG